MASASATLDARFAALADPTRRRIVERLARGDASVGELARPFDISLPAVSRHVRVLEEAGLVARWQEGRLHKCRLLPDALDPTTDWLARTRTDWERRLDRLERMLNEEE